MMAQIAPIDMKQSGAQSRVVVGVAEQEGENSATVVPFEPVRRARAAQPAAEADRALLTRIVQRDGAALRELMTRYLSAVLAAARRVSGDASEAEDVAQETFLRLWTQAAKLEVGPAGIGPWLRRVAVNLAIDRLRKGQRLDVTDEPPEQVEPADQLSALEAADTADRIDTALHRLPERQRIAISLFHFEEMAQRDVAAAMEISEDALESLLARGRRKLKQELATEWQQLLADDENV